MSGIFLFHLVLIDLFGGGGGGRGRIPILMLEKCTSGNWNAVHFIPMLSLYQGLSLRFQARGPKTSLDKNEWSKTGFLVIIHIILGP